jgi:hypothetical protein
VSGSSLSVTKYTKRAKVALAAAEADNPNDRERLLKWAQEWRAAAREGLTQSMPQRMGSRDR